MLFPIRNSSKEGSDNVKACANEAFTRFIKVAMAKNMPPIMENTPLHFIVNTAANMTADMAIIMFDNVKAPIKIMLPVVPGLITVLMNERKLFASIHNDMVKKTILNTFFSLVSVEICFSIVFGYLMFGLFTIQSNGFYVAHQLLISASLYGAFLEQLVVLLLCE